jgi:hypothetical protein
MTTDDSQFRRSCEAKHLTKIKQLGADPGAFEFDRQLDRLRSTSAEWHDEAESYFSSLKSWSFSRYELVDLIPLFHEAHVHIDVAQRMSRDEMQLPELRFAILSDPASTVRAYASEPRKKMGETVGGVAGGSLIWFCVGLKNYFDYLARSFTKAVHQEGRPFDGLYELVSSHGAYSALALYDKLSCYADPPDEDAGLVTFHGSLYKSGALDVAQGTSEHTEYATLLQALVSFVIGHEAGHIFLGHVGDQDKRTVISPETMAPRGVKAEDVTELEADLIGLLVLWDGMRHGNLFSTSIEYTCIAPFLFMSVMAGYCYYKLQDERKTTLWQQRSLSLLERAIWQMRHLGFERRRIDILARSVPVLMAASTSWVATSIGIDARDHVPPLFHASAEIADQAATMPARIVSNGGI